MNETSPRSAKRPRLSLACNECRRRKVKCDAGYPKCRNCQTRNSECITTNLRRPGVEVTREWVEFPEQASPSQDGTQTQIPTRNTYHNVTSRHSTGSSLAGTPTNFDLPSNPPPGNLGSAATVAGISPVHQPYENLLVREHSTDKEHATDRVKVLGGSSSQSLTRSLDVYLKAAHIQPVSSGFHYGMRFVEEMEISLILPLPPLPPPQKRESYLDTFFERIDPLYPVFDADALKDDIRKLTAMPNFNNLLHDEIPMLASAYLVMSLGVDEQAQRYTQEGLKYLHAAAGLLGHIILVPYLMAVRALVLFTVCFRGRNKDGVGWRTLAMAIRISQTLGLHRNANGPTIVDHEGQPQKNKLVQSRIWAVCCSLERVMQLEVGWPSMVEGFDCDQIFKNVPRNARYGFLEWHVRLAAIQGRISHHIYGHNPGERSSKEILTDTIRLDRELLSWAESIPEEYRPGNDLFVANHQFHITAFLSIQYYETMISLHRAALVSPISSFRSEVDLYCSDDPSRIRLQSGEAICISSARSIAKLAIELTDQNNESRIINASPILLACVVMGVSLVKNPGRRMQATDLEVFDSKSLLRTQTLTNL